MCDLCKKRKGKRLVQRGASTLSVCVPCAKTMGVEK